jgi:hypothetical protein
MTLARSKEAIGLVGGSARAEPVVIRSPIRSAERRVVIRPARGVLEGFYRTAEVEAIGKVGEARLKLKGRSSRKREFLYIKYL